MYRLIKTILITSAILLLVLLTSCGAGGARYPIPYATVGDYLGKWDGEEYQPIFLKGVNLGVGIPGSQAGNLAATREQYQRWLNLMGDMGFNALRVYTLHYPRFYEVFAEYNESHPNQPIYLFQGIWLDEDNPSGDLFDLTESFDDGAEEVIDCIYGNREIGERHGRAFGSYEIDVSEWVIGWIIGREIMPAEVLTTNEAHAELKSYYGKRLRLSAGNPTEVWAAARLDRLITYERSRYGFGRPVSFSNWPTLDPLTHPTEGSSSFEDVVSIDLADIDMFDAAAGYFASYHAYPYYPNFINEDPVYREAKDDLGPNNYLGYLYDLKSHYSNMPLLIAEFGVPSSWGNAHFSYSGMHHGGLDEVQQGYYNLRMLRNIRDSGSAGGLLFEWVDEWWKRTWIVDELEMPRDRFRLWNNVTSPEENFGLLAFDLGEPNYDKWGATKGPGRIREFRAAADAAFFHLRIHLGTGMQSGEVMTVGLDTYRDDLGESVLPDGVKTSNRSEFALVIEAPAEAQLYVTEAYDLLGIWHNTSGDRQLYHSTVTDGGRWIPVRWKNSSEHSSDDEQYFFPGTLFEIGNLQVRAESDSSSSLEAVVIGDKTVEIRLPWTLLQFTDPSTLSVLHDDRSTPERETAVSKGIAVSISFDGELLESGLYRWEPWDEAPVTTEREKSSLEILAEGLKTSKRRFVPLGGSFPPASDETKK